MQKEIKSLASDTMIYGVFTIVGRFLTFMLTPIYTNYLPVREVGEITNIFSLIAFLNVINTFGMESAFFRYYSPDDLMHNKKVFSHAYLTIVILSGITTLAVISLSQGIAPFISQSPMGSKYVILGIMIPFFDTLMVIPYGLLRMMRRAFRFSITRFILIILAITLNLIFIIPLRMGAEGVLLAQLLTNIFGAILFLPEILKYFSLKFDKPLFGSMMKFGLPTLPASLSSIIIQVADRPILTALTDSTQVALYSVNYRLGIPMLLFVSVFDYAYKPFYLRHYKDENAKALFSRIFTYYTMAGSIVILTTSFFIEFIVRLPFIGGRFINPEYWVGMHIIPLILGGYFFNGISNNLAAGFYIMKRTELLPPAVGLAATANIGMNFLLIPLIGYTGAAWSTFISYFTGALVLYFLSAKIYQVKYDWRRLLILAVSVPVLTYLVLSMTGGMELVPKLILRILALAGYFGLLLLTKFFTPGELKALKGMIKKQPLA